MKVEINIKNGLTSIKLISENDFEKTILANRPQGSVTVNFVKEAKPLYHHDDTLSYLTIDFDSVSGETSPNNHPLPITHH